MGARQLEYPRNVAVLGNYLPRRCGIATFTSDLCEAMAERLEVARLLQEGLSYRRISELTGASTTTVTRIAHWCKHGEGGYRTMLQRNRKKKL